MYNQSKANWMARYESYRLLQHVVQTSTIASVSNNKRTGQPLNDIQPRNTMKATLSDNFPTKFAAWNPTNSLANGITTIGKQRNTYYIRFYPRRRSSSTPDQDHEIRRPLINHR